jgi:hypothetical protein
MFYEIKKNLKKSKYTNFIYYHDLIWQNDLKTKYTDEFISIYKKIFQIIYLSADEAFTLYDNLLRTSHIKGDIAEVGVYKGGSAYILCAASSKLKKIYLFDTFEGLPLDNFLTKKQTPQKNWLNDTSIKKVYNLLVKNKKNIRINIIKGLFPKSVSEKINKKKFSFVHLDTDLYQSTFDSLKFFYPRLNNGGCIIVHDYNSYGCPGVKASVDKFVDKKKIYHKLFQISESQCMIIK